MAYKKSKLNWKIARSIMVLVFIVILIGVVIGLSIYVVSNLSTLKVSSSSGQHTVYIPLYYPYNGPVLSFSSQGSTYWMIELNVTFTYKGILAEGTPVTMSATGQMQPQSSNSSQDYRLLAVGVQGALTVQSKGELYSTPPAVNLNIVNGNLTSGGVLEAVNPQLIFWDVQGDYSPTITVLLPNETIPTFLTYTEVQLHVNSIDVVNQMNYNQVNLVLSVALVVFAFIESILLIEDIIPQEWKDRLNQKEDKHDETLEKLLEEVEKIKIKVDKIAEKQAQIKQKNQGK